MSCKFHNCTNPVSEYRPRCYLIEFYRVLCDEHTPNDGGVYSKTELEPTKGECIEYEYYDDEEPFQTMLWKSNRNGKWYCCYCAFERKEEICTASMKWSMDGCQSKHDYQKETVSCKKRHEMELEQVRRKYSRHDDTV